MTLPITRVATPDWLLNIKCPYLMTPTRIVVHNTANNASAMSEISYMLNNTNEVSYHFAVDYERAVQGLPLNRNGWHAGDGGSGIGNRQGIAIEICYSTGNIDDFLASEKNGAILVAMLLKQYGWDITKVTKHQDYSGKYCPHKTLDLGWSRFLQLVTNYLNGSSVPTQDDSNSNSDSKYGVGVSVCTNTIARSSDGSAGVYKGDWQGTITKVAPGAKYPYLLNNGDIGWTNDTGIDTDPHTPGKQSQTTNSNSSNTNIENYSGLITSQINGLAYHSKPDWSDATIVGTIDKGTTLTVVGRIKVDGVYMYKTKAGWYITSAKEYVDYSSKSVSVSTIQEGDWVGVKAGAKDYNGNSADGVVRGKVYYTVDELKGDRAVLDIPGICTPFHTKDLFK